MTKYQRAQKSTAQKQPLLQQCVIWTLCTTANISNISLYYSNGENAIQVFYAGSGQKNTMQFANGLT